MGFDSGCAKETFDMEMSTAAAQIFVKAWHAFLSNSFA